jgi:hypothetical protein
MADQFGVRNGFLADAVAANEDLRLQEEFVPAGLTLHVIDGVPALNIGIKAENHRAKALWTSVESLKSKVGSLRPKLQAFDSQPHRFSTLELVFNSCNIPLVSVLPRRCTLWKTMLLFREKPCCSDALRSVACLTLRFTENYTRMFT